VILAADGRAAGRRLATAAAVDAVVEERGVRRFYSRPDLVPPAVRVVERSGAPAPGPLFLAPSSGPGQRGPLITDGTGEPVWFAPSNPLTAMNFRAASNGGRSLLTWWEGRADAAGLGVGTHVVADDRYRVIARIPAAGGLQGDLHEFILTPNGTLLLTAWEIAERDLRSLGGPARWRVVGGVVQELAYPSGRLLFEWHSLDHVALEESHGTVGDPFDYFHVNSVAPTEDGNLLVSARNTWALYKIDRGSGEVIWRLGGKKSDFRLGPGTLFAWQHDARPHGRLVSLFDNGAAPAVQRESRGLVLALDDRRMQATLRRAYAHTPPVLARALGNVQLLDNGNVLVGFGTAPCLSEYGPDGRTVLDVRLPAGTENYRALRFPWTGRPLAPPTARVSSSSGAARLHVSWNGATEVASWVLRSGPSPARMSDAARSPRAGFETALPTPAGARYLQAVALDGRGDRLAASPTVEV
jgi:hypothetical protein